MRTWNVLLLTAALLAPQAMAAAAQSDGHAVRLTTNTTHAANPAMLKKLPYIPARRGICSMFTVRSLCCGRAGSGAPVDVVGCATFPSLNDAVSIRYAIEALAAARGLGPAPYIRGNGADVAGA